MALPVFRAASAKQASTGAAVTVGLPAGVAANDICILVATTIAGGSISITSAGSIATWTPIDTSPFDAGGDEKLYVWWGRYSSGSTGPQLTPGSDHICAGMAAYSGCITDDSVIHVSAAGSETTSDTTFSFTPGVSTTVKDCMVLCVCSTGADSNAPQFSVMIINGTFLVPVERMDYCTNSGGGGGFALDDCEFPNAQSLHTWSTALGTASKKNYVSFALRPPDTTTTKTTAGKARVQKTASGTTTGKARVQKTASATISGRASIAGNTTTSATTTGKARVQKTAGGTTTGKARVQKTASGATIGQARIQQTGTVTISGAGRIQNVATQTISGAARVQAQASYQITGQARIQQTRPATISGRARISSPGPSTTVQNISGRARITAPEPEEIQPAHVAGNFFWWKLFRAKTSTTPRPARPRTRRQTQRGRARIAARPVFRVSNPTSGRARIQNNAAKAQIGRARIGRKTTRVIGGRARITTSSRQAISGRARIIKNPSDEEILLLLAMAD